jgi:subtilisin-like proprotein convertase family protein
MRAAATAGIAAGGLVLAGAGSAAAAGGTLNARAADQIAALQRIKTSLTPAERKLDSRLAVALRLGSAPSARSALPRLRTGVAVAKSGLIEVDIRVTSVSQDLLRRLRAVGATVRHASPVVRSIRAGVPEAAISRVAAWKDVLNVAPAVGFSTAREPLPGSATPAGKAARVQRIRDALAAAQAAPSQGAVVSEGDKAHAANVARAQTHVTGTGVKVCALSDGVDSLAAEQAKGELPAVDVLPGQEGAGDEGTAMLEIVHDLAPRASLGFATADNGDASFADNIRALRLRRACDVIVDDVIYYNEDPFQDGPIAQAVNAVTSNGALYFSSAGNEGNTIDHTSGTYEGDFRSSGRGVAKVAGVAHDFDPGPGVQIFEPLSDASAGVPVTLFWADPLGRAADDYDLYELDPAGNVVAFSQDVQDGNDDPFEIMGSDFGGRLAVVKFAGATRYFQLNAFRGRFTNSSDGLVARVTPGTTRGHSAAVSAFSVAAAPAKDPLPFDLEPGDPPNPSGPFPNPFTTTQRPERFTADGPRRIFFSAAGAAITPGNFTHTGGTLRHKPDITAADGVSTGLAEFDPFFGTSAAAPHAAAIAALVLSGNPDATTADVRRAFNATALDLAPAGVDNRSGHGVIRADRVLSYTGATPQPLARASGVRVLSASGDGDAFLEPGETAAVAVTVTNAGDGPATGVNVTVSTNDSRATVTPHAQSYGTIASGATATRNYSVALSRTYPNGKPFQLTVKAAFAGRLSPTTRTFNLTTGRPAATVTTFAYTGPPVAIPDDDPDTGATVSLHVTRMTYASEVTFRIDGSRCTTAENATTVGIAHTFVGDLVGTLTGPGGQTVRLFQRDGGGGNNLCQVSFADSAAQPFSAVSDSDAPFTGSWRPHDPLATFLSTSVAGTWRFKVVDAAAADTGTIRAVSLHLRGVGPA